MEFDSFMHGVRCGGHHLVAGTHRAYPGVPVREGSGPTVVSKEKLLGFDKRLLIHVIMVCMDLMKGIYYFSAGPVQSLCSTQP